MSLTRLKNLISSPNGNVLYVNVNDFDASDSYSNRGNSLLRPFKSIQRALLEASKFSYVAGNTGLNDKFDQFTIMVYPGNYIIDNRPGLSDINNSPVLSEISNFDINSPLNELYKFNSTRGGVIVPRGTSIVGIDLRKTKIIPKFIPDPTLNDTGTLKTDYPSTGTFSSGTSIIEDDSRSTIFRITGSSYFSQFTIFDGDKNGVYKGSPNPSGVSSTLYTPNFSQHKLTVFEYACPYDLGLYYNKVSKAFSNLGIPSTDKLGQRIEETRIVGQGGIQADTIRLSTITYQNQIATAKTVNVSNPLVRISHGFSVGSVVRVYGSDDTITGISYNGSYIILSVSSSLSDSIIDQFSYQLTGTPNTNAVKKSNVDFLSCESESDTTDSASPYVFNCSLRSTYGICGVHANGAMVTGFKSIVLGQYTGISLQKDVNAFIRACPVGSDTYQDGSIASCSGVDLKPAHQDVNSKYKNAWKHYHIKCSNDAYVQAVSSFAVGFAEQYLAESGGDISLSNSESNFGSTGLIARGFKSQAFTKDVSGRITHIVCPRSIESSAININFYPIDIQKTRSSDGTKLYLYGYTDLTSPPKITNSGFTFGGKDGEILSVSIDNTVYTATVNPSGIATKSFAVNVSGNPVIYDNGNWCVLVSSGSSLYTKLQESKFASSSQLSTGVSYYQRTIDSRTNNQKVYRLRYFIPSSATIAAEPQKGFVLQPLGGTSSYSNTFFVQDIETVQKFVSGVSDGIYYLIVLNSNVSPTVSNFSSVKLPQNSKSLFAVADIDNPIQDFVASLSVADNKTIGLVYTQDGSGNTVTNRSITRETIIKWIKETQNAYTYTDNSGTYNPYDAAYTISIDSVLLTNKSGSAESRLVASKNINVEFRRPSTIKASNHKFEYIGFGSGNYSAAFPSKQTKVLSADEIVYSQALRDNGGVVYYSGINSNGDYFIGNNIVNPDGTISTSTSTISNISDITTNVFRNLTIIDNINVLGGTGSSILSNFYGNVTFTNPININPTWNWTGTGTSTFNGIVVNSTDTLSANNTTLIDLKVNGSSRYSVDKNGNIRTGTGSSLTTGNITATNLYSSGIVSTGTTIYTQDLIASATVSAGTTVFVQGNLESYIEATSTLLTATVLDSYSISLYRTARYTIQIWSASQSKYHVLDLLLTHNGTTPDITEMGIMTSSDSLGDFSTDISGGNARLIFTPLYANLKYNIKKTLIKV